MMVKFEVVFDAAGGGLVLPGFHVGYEGCHCGDVLDMIQGEVGGDWIVCVACFWKLRLG